jgi:O-antigen/teichoic acid export membrane protein
LKPAGHWRPYLISYTPVYFVLLAQLFYGNISRLIIESKLGVLAFGTASLALQIINLMSLVQTQVDKHLRPNLIHAVMQREVGAITLYARNYFVYYVTPIAITATGLSLVAAPLMGLLFGERWEAAGHPLSILSPLLVTVACLRFLDILVVTMKLGKINLVVNIAAASVLSLLLILMPAGYELNSYLFAIVLVQILHVMSISWVVIGRLKKMRT